MTESESRIDEWYVKEYAFSTTVVGLRGTTAVKAVNKLDDSDLAVPIMHDPDDLDDLERVDRDAVPEWGREAIEDGFEARAKNIDAIRNAGESA